MPTEATVVSRTELTSRMLRMKYSVPSVAAATTLEYSLPIDPYSGLCSLDEFYLVCSSTTVTVNVSDVEGAVYPSTDIKLRVEDINLSYDENAIGAYLYPSNAYLFLTIVNEDLVATGINTVTMILRR